MQTLSGEARTQRPELVFLDGLRGVLVILVMSGHALLSGTVEVLERDVPWVAVLADATSIRVPVFIVLSGYSLMIAVSWSRDLRLRGGWRGHLQRRARRLLPPYFAALLLLVAVLLALPGLQDDEQTRWSESLPLTWEALVTHVLLIHNLSPDLIYSIVGPWWTVAVEWQLGLLMPLILIAWRKVDPAWVVTAAFAVSVALSASGVLRWSAPISIGLFTLGMYVAWVTHGGDVQLAARRPRVIRELFERPRCLLALSLACLAAAVVLGWLAASGVVAPGTGPVRAALSGAGGAALIGLLTDRERLARDTRTTGALRRVLSSGGLRTVGLISYSAFLIHAPLLYVANLVFISLGLPTGMIIAIELSVVIPLILVGSAVFCWLFERPVMNSHQRRQLEALFPRPRRPRDGNATATRLVRVDADRGAQPAPKRVLTGTPSSLAARNAECPGCSSARAMPSDAARDRVRCCGRDVRARTAVRDRFGPAPVSGAARPAAAGAAASRTRRRRARCRRRR